MPSKTCSPIVAGTVLTDKQHNSLSVVISKGMILLSEVDINKITKVHEHEMMRKYSHFKNPTNHQNCLSVMVNLILKCQESVTKVDGKKEVGGKMLKRVVNRIVTQQISPHLQKRCIAVLILHTLFCLDGEGTNYFPSTCMLMEEVLKSSLDSSLMCSLTSVFSDKSLFTKVFFDNQASLPARVDATALLSDNDHINNDDVVEDFKARNATVRATATVNDELASLMKNLTVALAKVEALETENKSLRIYGRNKLEWEQEGYPIDNASPSGVVKKTAVVRLCTSKRQRGDEESILSAQKDFANVCEDDGTLSKGGGFTPGILKFTGNR